MWLMVPLRRAAVVVGRRAASGLLFEVARPAGWAAAAARKASLRHTAREALILMGWEALLSLGAGKTRP